MSSTSDDTFQTLAGGTQDLSALFGLFATDSVEKYAFDYTRGYLGPAMAMCSLLGNLGFVRSLLKLGVGAKACQKASYSLAPLQPYLGLGDDNLLPQDKFVNVYYVERKKETTFVAWHVRKVLQHTDQSLSASRCRHYIRRQEVVEYMPLVSVEVQGLSY